jgi:hypothetical protein
MGGMLAVRFARNYPERTSRLVLEDLIDLEDYRFFVPPQTTNQLYDIEMKMTPAKYRAFIKRYFVHWKPEYKSFVETRCRMMLRGESPRYAKAAAHTVQMIYRQPVRHEFPLIKVPAVLVVGLKDRTTVGRGRVRGYPERQRPLRSVGQSGSPGHLQLPAGRDSRRRAYSPFGGAGPVPPGLDGVLVKVTWGGPIHATLSGQPTWPKKIRAGPSVQPNRSRSPGWKARNAAVVVRLDRLDRF